MRILVQVCSALIARNLANNEHMHVPKPSLPKFWCRSRA